MATPDETAPLALTSETSLLTLFEAILGAPPGRERDNSAEVRVVEAQIQALRLELGLPEPVAPPAAVATPAVAAAPVHPPDITDEPSAAASWPREERRPTWRALVMGLATRRGSQIGALALVLGIATSW